MWPVNLFRPLWDESIAEERREKIKMQFSPMPKSVITFLPEDSLATANWARSCCWNSHAGFKIIYSKCCMNIFKGFEELQIVNTDASGFLSHQRFPDLPTVKNEYETNALGKECAHHWGHCFMPWSSLQEFNTSSVFQRDCLSPFASPGGEPETNLLCCFAFPHGEPFAPSYKGHQIREAHRAVSQEGAEGGKAGV